MKNRLKNLLPAINLTANVVMIFALLPYILIGLALWLSMVGLVSGLWLAYLTNEWAHGRESGTWAHAVRCVPEMCREWGSTLVVYLSTTWTAAIAWLIVVLFGLMAKGGLGMVWPAAEEAVPAYYVWLASWF